ncbi:MAG: ABC transporter ATP-binding protein [Oscillospiraceae bacterium]
MSDKKSVLRTENVIMQFGGVTAINDLTMEVNEGEIVALIGPNGAGKTTAFNVITGVYAPTHGSVYFHDKCIVSNFPKNKKDRTPEEEALGHGKRIKPTPDKITKLGVARTFQNIRLFKNLTVLENVMIAQHMRTKAGLFSSVLHLNFKEEKETRQSALNLLEILGLLDLKDEIASSLPYGQQRHLEIARALATKPSLLLLDEPAAGMNPQETDELTAFIKEIKDKFKLSVFMVEHHMDLVMEISDRIYVLDFGQLIAAGTPDEIQNNQRVIEAYLGVPENA